MLVMSNTATDWLILASGWKVVSRYRCFDFGWVLINSDPPPCPLSVSTTFHAYCGYLSGSVPINEMVSSPRWLVAQTGPNCGCTKLAPRPGCGILPTSTRAAILRSLESITATWLELLAAVMKYRWLTSQ